MGAVTYPVDQVVEFVAANFVPVQIQVSNTTLMQQFKVTWTPTFIVLDADGSERYRVVGFLAPEDFIATFMVAKARWHFEAGRYGDALAAFGEALKAYPNGPAAAEAIFYQVVAGYKHSHDPKPLREAYDLLASQYAQSEWARRAEPYRLIPL